ncbi:MAG: serine/threonine protein kinase [Phycisphaerales bacterium]|nr:serine/threonine protein kinase [Phycisphaerales bacterium]
MRTDETATITAPLPASGSAARGSAPSGRGTVVTDDAFFAPGAIIGERYRIVARLGKGGMGEVFRADDLKVGQPVALKFLPRATSENAAWLERFRGEVRIARQVAHPNVCRMYDLGEAMTPDGKRTFLSMEYIDGEDMGSLLRRIGRLPKDKAVQVARQIGAGLAAAHAQGVIHRDLKPANIMLDGRGHARLMDFGIAGLADQIGAGDIRSGTPAYMAPEQRDGREVSARSDIYSLGLVLYELFTGRRAFDEARGGRERPGDSRTSSEISRPSTHAQDLDPVIDRLIMRCLQDDPVARPGSAMAVIAALPGGDPLQAALEAGETPSPELVAAAGERSAVRASRVSAMVAAVLALLAVTLVLAARQGLLWHIDLPRSPVVLADRAGEIIRSLGYTEKPADTAWGLSVREDYLDGPGTGGAGGPGSEKRERLARLRTARPQPVAFWYRTSPKPMMPWQTNGDVSQRDPPRSEPGMVSIELDSAGRLEALAVVTDPVVRAGDAAASAAGPAGGPDWGALFTLGGLDLAKFRPAEPSRTPPHYADVRAAWDGTYGETGEPVRIEAAAYRGRPVYFAALRPWEVEPPPEAGLPMQARIIQSVNTSLVMAALGFSAWQARRNVKQGRGDVSGARSLAWVMFGTMLVAWLLRANHQLDIPSEWGLILTGTALPLLIGGLSWMMYLALEPFVRRRDPVMLVSWTRLLAGGFSDPAVGRDVLIGVIGGLGYLALGHVAVEVATLTKGDFIAPINPSPVTLAGWSGVLVAVQLACINSVLNGMLFVLAFVGLMVLLRRRWAAGVALMVPAAFLMSNQAPAGGGWVQPLTSAIGGLWMVLYLMRFGMLAVLAALLTATTVATMPATPDVSAWYGQGMVVAVALVLGLTIWAARAARGGRWSHAAPAPR